MSDKLVFFSLTKNAKFAKLDIKFQKEEIVINCQEMERRLSLLVDGHNINIPDLNEAKEHLGGCSKCQELASRMIFKTSLSVFSGAIRDAIRQLAQILGPAAIFQHRDKTNQEGEGGTSETGPRQ